MNLSNRLDTLESEIQMIMRLYQVAIPNNEQKSEADRSSANREQSQNTPEKRKVLKDLELNKNEPSGDKASRPPSSGKKSITKKLITFKPGFSVNAMDSRDEGSLRCQSAETLGQENSSSTELTDFEQASKLIARAGNKYTAFKNCLNTIKDTLTKGGESLPQLMQLNPRFGMGSLSEDTPHESLQYSMNARQTQLALSNNPNWSQNELAIGEPQPKHSCCVVSERKLADLQKLLEESRDQIKVLVASKRDALDVFKQLREKYDSLRVSRKGALEQITTLKSQNSELLDRYEKEKKLREKEYRETAGLRRALDALRCTSDHLKRSNEGLLRQLRGSNIDVEELKNSVEETKERLKCSEHQLSLCDAEIKRRDASRHEALMQNVQLSELQVKCEQLEGALRQAQQLDEERCLHMDQEITRLKANAEDKQMLYDHERQESNMLIQELNNSLTAHKEKINELSAIVLKQDGLIQEQLQAIEVQENQIKEIQYAAEQNSYHTEQLQKKLAEAEEHIRQNCNTLDTSNYDVLLEQTRQELEDSRDSLLIKDKIIEDQVGTIQGLKHSLGEKTEQLHQLSHQRDRERSKYKLALGELQVQNRKAASGNLIQQRQRNLAIVHEDEQRRAFKQLMVMRREKDHAIFTAHYVTKQLIQTVSEFEKQVETQRKVHKMLITVLGDKEKMLNKYTKTEGELLSHKLELRNLAEEKHREDMILKALTARDTCLAVLNKLPTGDLHLEQKAISEGPRLEN